MELDRGHVEARSAGAHEGSEFIVRLPVARPGEPTSLRSNASAEPVAPRAARILVIDDNRDVGESLVALLELDGHDARAAHDGETGLELAGELRPDVILLDIGLPGKDGYQIAREIRSLPWGSSVLLIAATGWGEGKDKARAREAGFDFHLTKPVDLDVLARILKERKAATTDRAAEAPGSG